MATIAGVQTRTKMTTLVSTSVRTVRHIRVREYTPKEINGKEVSFQWRKVWCRQAFRCWRKCDRGWDPFKMQYIASVTEQCIRTSGYSTRERIRSYSELAQKVQWVRWDGSISETTVESTQQRHWSRSRQKRDKRKEHICSWEQVMIPQLSLRSANVKATSSNAKLSTVHDTDGELKDGYWTFTVPNEGDESGDYIFTKT